MPPEKQLNEVKLKFYKRITISFFYPDIREIRYIFWPIVAQIEVKFSIFIQQVYKRTV